MLLRSIAAALAFATASSGAEQQLTDARSEVVGGSGRGAGGGDLMKKQKQWLADLGDAVTRAAGDHRTQLSELTKNVRFDVADYATSLKVKIDDLTRDIAKQSSEVSQWKDLTNNRANFFKEKVADFDVLRKTADGKTREFGDATATEMDDT